MRKNKRFRLLYDEFNQAGASFQDAERAKLWEERARKLGGDPAAGVERVRRCLGIRPNDVLADIGAGAGVFAAAIAQHCRHVYAVDISPHMLELAKQKAKAKGIKNISFIHAGFLTLDLKNKKCDHVVAMVSLHHLPDFWKMVALRRIYHILRDGGKLYISDPAHSFDIDDYKNIFTRDIKEIEKKTHDAGLVEDAATTIREEFATFDWIM
ncbi:MAG: class I SAM-dependent methyltransferase [Lentisphaerae bacterium]|nr:class I SAM-dependent methyltransferase [Lentisphaerota bacterium]